MAEKGVGAVRLGECDDLREIAIGRVVPERLMVTEGLIQVDDDRAVWRRPAVNVDREVVEYRARRGIVEPLLRWSLSRSKMKSAPDTSRKVLAAAPAPPGSDE